MGLGPVVTDEGRCAVQPERVFFERGSVMSPMYPFPDILRGSQALDQMREDISNVISLLLGLVTKEDIYRYHSNGTRSVSIDVCDGQQWHIYMRFEGTQGVECRIDAVMFNAREVWRYGGGKVSVVGYARVEVLIMYEALQGFVDGMIKAFPQIAHCLNEFFVASHRIK